MATRTIQLPREKYQELMKKARAYERIQGVIEEEVFFLPPPVRSRKSVIDAFRKTGKYSKRFLQDLARGLKRSSYFEK